MIEKFHTHLPTNKCISTFWLIYLCIQYHHQTAWFDKNPSCEKKAYHVLPGHSAIVEWLQQD